MPNLRYRNGQDLSYPRRVGTGAWAPVVEGITKAKLPLKIAWEVAKGGDE
jgi:hypothetical protein